jgi:glycerophosphoryl diester phosphodiesterase
VVSSYSKTHNNPIQTLNFLYLYTLELLKIENMAQITIELDNSLAEKLDSLMRFFGSKDMMFSQFIEYHRKNAQREIARMQIDLDAYEAKYEMDSETFYQSFEKGDLDDSKDYMLWSGIYEMQLDSKKRLAELS